MESLKKLVRNIIRLYIKIKKIVIITKYKYKNINLSIGSDVRFYQKIIFSGKGKIVLRENISLGYKLGGFYSKGITELQARYPNSRVIINNNVYFNNSTCIIAANRIEIMSDCKIGANVTMMDFEAHGTDPENRNKVGEHGEIIIGRNVWIGNNVIILKNVQIGENSIIAAGSVVLKGKYPANVIIGGNPARVVKTISNNKKNN
jgi:acetyltransferase-like isoleucine patch superfamily enzyme